MHALRLEMQNKCHGSIFFTILQSGTDDNIVKRIYTNRFRTVRIVWIEPFNGLVGWGQRYIERENALIVSATDDLVQLWSHLDFGKYRFQTNSEIIKGPGSFGELLWFSQLNNFVPVSNFCSSQRSFLVFAIYWMFSWCLSVPWIFLSLLYSSHQGPSVLRAPAIHAIHWC